MLRRSKPAVASRVGKLRKEGRLDKFAHKGSYDTCSRCNERPKAVNSDGSLRSWCKPCDVENSYFYYTTEQARKVRRKSFVKKHGRLPILYLDHSEHGHKNASERTKCRREWNKRNSAD